MFIDKTKFEHLGTFTNTGSTDIEFHFPQRAQVKRIVLACTTAASAAGTVSVDKNGTAIGSFATPATVADNALLYIDIGHVDADGETGLDDSTVYKGGVTFVEFDASDYLTLEASGTANSGVYEAYVEYIPEGLNEAEVVTKVAYTAA
jgi:hypothetical protein